MILSFAHGIRQLIVEVKLNRIKQPKGQQKHKIDDQQVLPLEQNGKHPFLAYCQKTILVRELPLHQPMVMKQLCPLFWQRASLAFLVPQLPAFSCCYFC
jgi:hypothetical protein